MILTKDKTLLSLATIFLIANGFSAWAQTRAGQPAQNAGGAPTAQSLDLALDEDTTRTLTLAATDPDGDQLSYQITEAPLYGTLSGSGAQRVYTPQADYYGVDFFRYTATDKDGQSAAAKVTLTIHPVSDNDCVQCQDGGVFVNQDVRIDLNTPSPSLSGPLAPYFHYDTSAADPAQWRAYLDMGARKLMLYGGAVIDIAPITTPSGATVTPALEILTDCEVYIAQSSGIRNLADQPGKLALQSGGNMRIEGFLLSQTNGGQNGSIHVSTRCGDLTTGDASRIESIGGNGQDSSITLMSCGDGAVELAGLVESRYDQAADLGAELQIIAYDGPVSISGTAHHETQADGRLVYSGVRALAEGDAAPGRITVYAATDVSIYGYGFSWGAPVSPFDPNHQEGTIAVKKGDTVHKGGRIAVTAKRGRMLAFDHALDNANPLNSFGEIRVEADKDILLRGGSENAPATVIDNSSLGGANPAGGANLIRSYNNKVFLDTYAQIRADGSARGVNGQNHITSCEGLFALGQVSPQAVEANACGDRPAGMYLVPQFISTPVLEADPGQPYTYAAQAQDPACRPLRYRLTDAPAGMSVDPRSGLITWSPNDTQTGEVQVSLEATTGCAATTQTYLIMLEDDTCAQAPVLLSPPVTAVNEGAVYQYQPQATDNGSEPLTWSLAHAPTGMAMDPDTGLITWNADALYMQSLIADNTTCPGFDLSVHTLTLTQQADGAAVAAILVNRGQGELTGLIQVELLTTDVDGEEVSLGTLQQDGLSAGTQTTVTFSGLDPIQNDLFIRVSGGEPGADCIAENTYALAALVKLVVTDSCDLEDEQNFLVRVINLNQAPTLLGRAVTAPIPAGAPFQTQVNGHDGDRGDALTFSLENAPAGMTIAAHSGLITWTPTEDQAGVYGIPVTVTDLGGLSDTWLLELEVVIPNKPPVADNQTLTTSEETPVAFSLTGADPDGDAITFTVQTQPANGILAGAPPHLTYTPLAGFTGVDSLTFTTHDGQLVSSAATVTFHVSPINSPPTAHDQTLTTEEETPIAVTLTATDPEGDALTLTITQQPRFGVLTGSGADWTYTPSADFHGRDDFLFIANDGAHNSLPATVTINVTPVNEAPVAEDVFVATAEDEAVDFGLIAQDPDGDALTYSLLSQPANGTLSGTAPALTYQPNTAFSGVDQFTYRVNDGALDSNIATVTINVNDINNPPYFTSEPNPNVVLESTAVQGDPIDLRNFTFVDLPIGSQGKANWVVEDEGYTVLQRVNARASVFLSDFDLENDQIQGKWKVETTSDDDFIGFVFGWQDPTHYYLLDWKQNAQDSARRGLSVKKISTEPENIRRIGLWSTYNGFGVETLYHENNMEFPWRDRVEYDFYLSFHPGEFIITVSEGDQVLKTITIQDDTYTTGRFGFFNYSQGYVRYSGFTRHVLAGNVFTYDVTTADPDGDPTTVTLLDAPEGMSFDPQSGALRWITAPSTVGVHPVRLRVEDPYGLYSEQAFEVVVQDINPVVTSKPRTSTFADLPYAYEVAATDPNAGDVLSFELVTAPVGMTVSALGAVSWSPGEVDLGEHPVTIRVSDQDGNHTDHSYTLTVNPLPDNQPPYFTYQPVQTATVGRPYTDVPSAIDPDGDDLLISLVQAPYRMQLFDGANLTWVPTADQVGDHEIILEVSDGVYASETLRYTLSVSAPNASNHAPVLESTPYSLALINQTWTYQMQSTDADGDTLSYILDRGPEGMTIDTATGLLTYTPGLEDLGEHPVQVRVSDGVGGVVPQYFSLYVATRADNERPVIHSTPEGTIAPEQTFSYQVIAEDPDGDAVTLSLTHGPAGMTLDADGLIQWTPTMADLGVHVVTVRAEDEHLAAVEQHFVLQVTDAVNHNPVFTSSADPTVIGGQPYTYQALAHDEDNDPLTWVLATAPAGMTVTPAGLVQWNPPVNLIGTFSVTLVVDDGRGGRAVQTFTLTATLDDNASPAITSLPVNTTAPPEETWTYQASAIDPDGDLLTWSLLQAPSGMTVNAAGLVSWTPSLAQAGDHELTLAVFDTHGVGVTQIFTVTVTNQPNRAPAITSTPVLSGLEGLTYVYQVRAQDADFDALIYTITQGPAGMTVGPNGRITWRPTTTGDVTVTVTVADGRGGRDSQTFSITVEAGVDLPADLFQNAFTWLAAQQAEDGGMTLSNHFATPYQATAESVLAFNGWTGTPQLNRAGATTFLSATNGLDTESISLWSIIQGSPLNDGRLPTDALAGARCPDGYGNNAGYDATAFDTALALQAMNKLSAATATTRAQAVNDLIQQQNADGGWGLPGNASLIPTTAMALTALHPHLGTNPAAAVAGERAKTWLLAQREDQWWQDAYKTALAVQALFPTTAVTELLPAVQTLIAQQQSDGSWQQEVYITAVVLKALQLFDFSTATPLASGNAGAEEATRSRGHKVIDLGYFHGGSTTVDALTSRVDLSAFSDDKAERRGKPDASQNRPVILDEVVLLDVTNRTWIAGAESLDGMIQFVDHEEPGLIRIDVQGRDLIIDAGAGLLIEGAAVDVRVDLVNVGNLELTAEARFTTEGVQHLSVNATGSVLIDGYLRHDGDGLAITAGSDLHLGSYGTLEMAGETGTDRSLSLVSRGGDLIIDGLLTVLAEGDGAAEVDLLSEAGNLTINGDVWSGVVLVDASGAGARRINLAAAGDMEVNGAGAVRIESAAERGAIAVQPGKALLTTEDETFQAGEVQIHRDDVR